MQLQLSGEQQNLVAANVRLVHHVAKKYRHIPPADYEDLILRLYERLCIGARSFDPSRGTTISTFMVKSLQNEAKNYFRDEMWRVKVPRRIREQSFAQLEKIEEEDGGLPDATMEVLRSCAVPLSLDLVPEEDQPGIEISEAIISEVGGNQRIARVFAGLTPAEQSVLRLLMEGGTAAHIQFWFKVSKPLAQRIIMEVREKAQELYLAVLDNRPNQPHPQTPTLTVILRRRFDPPRESWASVRARVLSQLAA